MLAVSGGARRSTTYTPSVEAMGCQSDEDKRDCKDLRARDAMAEEGDRDKDGDELPDGRKGSEHRGSIVFDGEQNERLSKGRRHRDDGNVGKCVRVRRDETPNVDELESHHKPCIARQGEGAVAAREDMAMAMGFFWLGALTGKSEDAGEDVAHEHHGGNVYARLLEEL